MEIINETFFQPAAIAGRIGFPGHSLTFIVKGTFDLIHSNDAVFSENQLFPTGDEFYPDDDEGTGSCRYASDFAYFKPKADILLAGRCHAGADQAQKASRVIFQVGSHSKILAVFGNRYWNPVSRTISGPEPFNEMVLRYENSFGGTGDQRNPVGKGISRIKMPNGQTLWPLPNIEDIDHLIDSPNSQPKPEGFGPLGSTWQERYKKLGTYKGDWLKTRWPWYPMDFDWSYFNVAPSDMQVDGYLKGDESLYFENLHPQFRIFESRLPGIYPRLFINKHKAPNSIDFHFNEVPLNLDTLWVDMDAEKLVLVWRGVIEVRSEDYEEVSHAFIVSENNLATSRPNAEYHEWFLQIVAGQETSAELVTDEKEVGVEVSVDIDAKIEKAVKDVHAALIEAGITPDAELPEPSEEDKANNEALLQKLGLAEIQPIPVITREAIQQQIAAGKNMSGMDLRGIDLSELNLSGGIFRQANLTGVNLTNAFLVGADFSEADMSETNLAFADLRSSMLTKTDMTRANLANSKLDGAFIDETIMDNANLKHAEMRNISAKGASFFEADFSHATLSDAQCQASDFSIATLINTDFSGADLTDASFEKVKSRGINFNNANLSGFRASGGSDFCQGNFRNISAPYSIWEDAVLDQADFSFAYMEGANFASASLKKAVFYGTDLRFARLSKAILNQAKCIHMNLFQATLEKADLTKTDFSAANLYGAEFLGATVNQTKFIQTNLKMTKLLHFNELI